MKKVFANITLVCILMMLFAATASADVKVPSKELTFGNLYIYMPYKDVVKMYGQPARLDNPYMPRPIYVWDNGLRVRIFTTSKGPYVDYFSFGGSDETTFVTPRGIHIGSTEQEVVDAYGFDMRMIAHQAFYFVWGRDGYMMTFSLDKETHRVTHMSVDEHR